MKKEIIYIFSVKKLSNYFCFTNLLYIFAV